MPYRSRRTVALALLLITGAFAQSRGLAAPDPESLGADLFIAIRQQDQASVDRLLARGADPNRRNWLGLTPLQWAAMVGNLGACRSLLVRGADLHAGALFGNALMTAALKGSPEVVSFLLSRGARMEEHRPDRLTPLMAAAINGQDGIARALLDRRAAPDARDLEGMTALMHAARLGKLSVARLLLARGAKPNLADNRGWTALSYAAANGHAEVVRALLSRGAKPGVKARDGRTPLALASRYSGRPEVLKALAQSGSRTASGGKAGRRTARKPSQEGAVGDRLLPAKAAGAPRALPTARQAAELSFGLLQRTTAEFNKRVQCVSCHHQGLGLMVAGVARQRGLKVDAALAREQIGRVYGQEKSLLPLLERVEKDPSAAKLVPAVDIGDTVPVLGYGLAALAAHGYPSDRVLGLSAVVLATQQHADGSFPLGFTRGPMQSSTFTMTALAVRSLKSYPPGGKAGAEEPYVERAREWLLRTPPRTTEDRASRLLGLAWAGATSERVRRAAEEVTAGQRPDGGWSRQPGLASDAYATGLSLYALAEGGRLSTTDAVYRRGVRFLLRTQDPDGSWYVNKEVVPLNFYMDVGFPHGESQYISYGATGWATLALLMTLPESGEPVEVASTAP